MGTGARMQTMRAMRTPRSRLTTGAVGQGGLAVAWEQAQRRVRLLRVAFGDEIVETRLSGTIWQ